MQIKFSTIYFISITSKFFFKLGQKKFPPVARKDGISPRGTSVLWVSLEPNYDLSFPWADISGTAGSRREVKPACVCPNVKEFKTFFFFSFDCRTDIYGGGKEQRACVASSLVQKAKITSESWYLYYPRQDRWLYVEFSPAAFISFVISTLLLVHLFPTYFPANTFCARHHAADILSTVFPSPPLPDQWQQVSLILHCLSTQEGASKETHRFQV